LQTHHFGIEAYRMLQVGDVDTELTQSRCHNYFLVGFS
jgi:hypothetical protein